MTEASRLNDITVTPVAFRDRDDTGYMQRLHPAYRLRSPRR